MNILPQGLADLPNDLIFYIFNLIHKITDKRQFIRTCIRFNNLTKKLMKDVEKQFIIKNYKNVIGNHDMKNFNNVNSYFVEKFTFELMYDDYLHLMPMSYLTPKNKIIMEALAYRGDIKLLQKALDNSCEITYDTFTNAAENGHLETIKWLSEKYGDNRWGNRGLCYYACKNNCLHILEQLHCENYEFDGTPFYTAAKYGNLEILIWAKKHGLYIGHNSYVYAGGNGHLDVVKWGIENDEYVPSWDACCEAAGNGQLEVLKWLRNYGCEWNPFTCTNAASEGQLECLKWAVENGCEWDEDCLCEIDYTNPAQNGHFEVVKWAFDNGFKHNWNVAFYAAGNGDFKMLKWALDNGHDLNKSLCYSAASSGHLNILKWLRENGCEWDRTVCSVAIEHGHFEIYEWAKENGCLECYDCDFNWNNIFRK